MADSETREQYADTHTDLGSGIFAHGIRGRIRGLITIRLSIPLALAEAPKWAKTVSLPFISDDKEIIIALK